MARAAASPANDQRSTVRRDIILQEAAKLFAKKGFASTTMREIAKRTGILAGSIYYHFPSKEDLYQAVVSDALETLSRSVAEAIDGVEEPWEQLERAACTHCAVLLESREVAALFTPQYFAQLNQRSRRQLVSQRDRYEAMIAKIVERLDLPPLIDRHIFRLHFLGALNWTSFWYRPSPDSSPEEIASQLVAMLREGRLERG